MDAQQFDRLAKVVAGSGSRRGVLRGLAGALGFLALGRGGLSASAQGSLGPGDACWDDSQCSPSVMNYSPLVCADNGFEYDGPLNCCTGEGGFCFSDEGCCGPTYCNADARCVSTSSAGPYFPGPGDPCQVNDECFALGLVCDYVGLTGDSRCCGYEGSSCGWDGQCCGWLTCAGGFCTSGAPAPSGGLPLGAQCQYAAQCSGGGYYVDCADNGGYVPACCLLGGQSCSSDLDCCMPNNCIGGYCGSGGPSGCTGPGCTCISGVLGSCDYGLECCVQGDPGAAGICGPVGNCYSALAGNSCTGEWCDCAVQDPYACDPRLVCCGPGERNARGTCLRREDC